MKNDRAKQLKKMLKL